MRLLTPLEDSWISQALRKGKAFPSYGQYPPAAWQRLITKGLTDEDALVVLLLTFDVGAHASGWWRNSEYEQCWHLSISARSFLEGDPELPTQAEVEAWGRAIFGDNLAKTWLEPPARHGDPHRPYGQKVTHIRLFLDKSHQPIQPRGEVYTLVPFSDGTSPEKVFR